MDIQTAKQIKIADYLHSLGFSPVKQQGINLWYKSPLREETEASFKVNTERNQWYDFALGKGRNIIALEAVFGLKEEYGYKELEDALIKSYTSIGVKLNHQKAVPLITMLRNKRMIVQENGRKYTFMPDFHY